MRIKIKNWDKYNPKTSYTTNKWFRFENNFWHDPVLFATDARTKMVFLFLMSQTSIKDGAPIKICFRQIENTVEDTGEDWVESTIEILLDGGLIEVEDWFDLHPNGKPKKTTHREFKFAKAYLTETGQHEKLECLRGLRKNSTGVREKTTLHNITEHNITKQSSNEDSVARATPPDPPPPKKLKFDEWDVLMTDLLIKAIKKINPYASEKKFNRDAWANEFRLLRGDVGGDTDRIEKTLDWIFTSGKDDFWQSQIQSPKALRKHWNKITAQAHRRGQKSEAIQAENIEEVLSEKQGDFWSN